MRKLNLIAMSNDKDGLLNALQKTGAAEIKLHDEWENTVALACDGEAAREKLLAVERSLETLIKCVETVQKRTGESLDCLRDGFDVGYAEFMAAEKNGRAMDELAAQIDSLTDEKNRLKGELAKKQKRLEAAFAYAKLTKPFSVYTGSLKTKGRLGTIPANKGELFQSELSEIELCAFEKLDAQGGLLLFHVVAHKSVTQETDSVLATYGFSDCPYTGAESGKETYLSVWNEIEEINEKIQKNEDTVYALKENIRALKVYRDYLAFALEKEETADKLRATERTFLLEAYVPAPAEERVGAEIANAAEVSYFEFSDPTEEEEPPTLLENNSMISNFESITNTYSVPNYREFDPNTVMAFFYSLFMGFIVGDAGYGLLMALVGGFLWLKNKERPTGLSRLAGSFAVGGVFAILWGLLFNSLFGFGVFATSVLPDPQDTGYMWTFVGISVPPVLIIAMLLGIFQLFAGYICKAAQEWRRGNVFGGIFEGISWAIFSAGVGLAIVGLITEFNLPVLATVGGLTAGGGLLFAMLTAGWKEKGFGKFAKGFGAAYGVINYASDILSYARLYGLMLSGAVIAKIIATYSAQFLASGNVLFIALAAVLLLVGNVFNIAISLLGAYIHDARLQYVEFYGRFYEGEGRLFRPLGSEHKHIYLLSNE